jgi:hypothetical protein
VCAFFCVCLQLEALRKADHPPKESYRKKGRKINFKAMPESGECEENQELLQARLFMS